METNTFFRTFLEGTEEIISSDKACADVLRWANDMAVTASGYPSLEEVAAFLLLGLKSKISGMVSFLRTYQGMLYDGEISDEEWEVIDEKNELWELEETLSKQLLEIVSRANASEKRFKSAIEQHKNVSYDGARFRLETVRKMRRYLDSTLLFLKSLEEVNVPFEERTEYTSKLLEMGKSEDMGSLDSNTEEDNQAHSNYLFILGMLKEAGIIAFDNHIPKIADKGIDFLRRLCQEQVTNEFSELEAKLGDQLRVTENEAINIFKDLKVIESDGQTISETGLVFFSELAKDAFKSGLPIGYAKINLEEKQIKSQKDAEEILKESKEITDDSFKERVIEKMLASAREIEGIDSIVLGWIANKKF